MEMVKFRPSYFFLFVFIFLSEIGCLALPKGNLSPSRKKTSYEVDMFAAPDPKEPELQEILFNHQLSKEIRIRYVEQFGSVDTEALIYRSSRYAEMTDKAPDQSTFDATRNQRKQFGEFILKRLAEWHADNQMKSKTELRKAYEVKQAISQVAVPVTQDSKLEVHLSLIGDTIDILYFNPYANAKYIINPATTENKLIVSKPYDTKTNVLTEIWEKEGIASFEIQRLLAPNTTASLKESSWFHPFGNTPRETKTSLIFGRAF